MKLIKIYLGEYVISVMIGEKSQMIIVLRDVQSFIFVQARQGSLKCIGEIEVDNLEAIYKSGIDCSNHVTIQKQELNMLHVFKRMVVDFYLNMQNK